MKSASIGGAISVCVHLKSYVVFVEFKLSVIFIKLLSSLSSCKGFNKKNVEIVIQVCRDEAAKERIMHDPRSSWARYFCKKMTPILTSQFFTFLFLHKLLV